MPPRRCRQSKRILPVWSAEDNARLAAKSLLARVLAIFIGVCGVWLPRLAAIAVKALRPQVTAASDGGNRSDNTDWDAIEKVRVLHPITRRN